jgi:hypothetical protein
LSTNILVRPIINLFSGEYEGAKFRGFITANAAKKENSNSVKQVILEALEYYKTLHPEALETRNGVKVPKPRWKVELEEK